MGARKITDDRNLDEVIRHEVDSQLKTHLEKLKVLEKLDVLKDEKTLKALRGLEKVDWLHQNWMKFVCRSVINLCMDFLKIVVLISVGAAALLYTIPTGHLSRILPVLGYGDGPRVNAGLSLLSNEVNVKDFDKYFNNVMLRIDREIAMYYDFSERFPGQFEYSLLDDLYSYDYLHSGVDLKLKVRTDMGNKLNFARTEFMKSYEYDMEFSRQAGALEEDLEKIRSFKIFASQGRYLQGLSQLKMIKEPLKIRSYRFAVRWAFHQSYLDYRKDLQEWIGKNL